MPVTVVVGGQFGSEGKGKVAHYLVKEECIPVAVRVGGPNSGHTVVDEAGNSTIFRQLPTAAILPDVTCVIAAGSYVDPEILLGEIARVGASPGRVFVDPNAMIVSRSDIVNEEKGQLRESIGSTLSGTGASVHRRISRLKTVKLAKENQELRPYVRPVLPYLREQLNAGRRVLIEGTQGFGLSLLHSPYYPFVTSRDTTAAGFVSEVGLSPLDVDDIVLVLRAFPIRVSGNSGPLPEEITWDTVTEESGSRKPIIEFTSVTKSKRRVGRFHPEVVRLAIMVNNPTRIVLNHIDHVEHMINVDSSIKAKANIFIKYVERLIDSEILYLGFGAASLYKRSDMTQKVKVG